MEEDFRIFDVRVSLSGTSLIITIPKSSCELLDIKADDIVQVKIKKEFRKTKKNKN